jgi:hypothetical protein
MNFWLLGFLFGFGAVYIILRLNSGRQLRPWEQKILPPAGWALMSASISFAVLLLTLAVFDVAGWADWQKDEMASPTGPQERASSRSIFG